MSLLGALVSPTRRTSFGEAPLGLLVVDVKSLDPNMPPSFYTVLKNGGSVIWNEPTVQVLAQRYFSVASHDVTPAEAAWLEQNAPTWVAGGRPKILWFATCPTGATVDANGQPVCGNALPVGVQEIPPRPGTNPCSRDSIPEAASGIVRPGDLERMEQIKPPGSTMCFRYFGGNPEVSDAQMDSARETIRVYDRLLRSVESVERNRQQYGGDFTVAQKNALSASRAWIATNTQAVEKSRPYLFSGSGNLRTPRVARTRFGVEPLTAAVVIAVVIGAVFVTWKASAAYLADAEIRKMGIQLQADLNASMQPRIDELMACIKDPARTQAQRQSCNQALRSLSDLTGNMDPDKDAGGNQQNWGEVAKWGTIGLGVLAGVYLLGPAIRGASKATGESFRASEQKMRARRRLISDISG
jgi:hypothetical protein